MNETAQDLLEKYIGEVEYEEMPYNEVTISKVNSLDIKQGIVCPTSTTPLFINRKLSVMTVLNIPTVMEYSDEFSIMDAFGIVIWNGDAESIVEFIQGFNE